MIIKQFFIILATIFFGWIASEYLNLPIPSNVVGFIILFLALYFNIIKIKQVEKVSDFIIKYLALFFVVPVGGVIVHFKLIGSQLLQIIIPLLISLLIGLFVSAKVTELCIGFSEKRRFHRKQEKIGGGDK
ncbi:MAG: CidA/LrgA family protein [Anaerovoracaceae bacterium]